jgi:hypothetical protein
MSLTDPTVYVLRQCASGLDFPRQSRVLTMMPSFRITHLPGNSRIGSAIDCPSQIRSRCHCFPTVLASFVPILWKSGIGSDVMKPIAAPIVGGLITSTVHVLILVPVFFVMMKERALKRGTLTASSLVAAISTPRRPAP